MNSVVEEILSQIRVSCVAQDFADEVINTIEIGVHLNNNLSSVSSWLAKASKTARQLERLIADGVIDYDNAFSWAITEWHTETYHSVFEERVLEPTAESALRVLLGEIEDITNGLSRAINGYSGDDDDDNNVWGGTYGA